MLQQQEEAQVIVTYYNLLTFALNSKQKLQTQTEPRTTNETKNTISPITCERVNSGAKQESSTPPESVQAEKYRGGDGADRHQDGHDYHALGGLLQVVVLIVESWTQAAAS